MKKRIPEGVAINKIGIYTSNLLFNNIIFLKSGISVTITVGA